MGSSQSFPQQIQQDKKQLNQQQLALKYTTKSGVQFVAQLPTETVVEILMFMPTEQIVLNFVFISHKFSAICIPILRKRFADNESTWVKTFTDPGYDAFRLPDLQTQNLLLHWANIENGIEPVLRGSIWVTPLSNMLGRSAAHHRRSSLIETAAPNVTVHFKCGNSLRNEDWRIGAQDFQPIEAFYNTTSGQRERYDFEFPVPKNTHRFMQLKFYIEYNVRGQISRDDNQGNLYVFNSEGMVGRIQRYFNIFRSCIRRYLRI